MLRRPVIFALVLLACGCKDNSPPAPPATLPAAGTPEIPSPPEHTGRGTIADRLAYYGPAARSRLAPHFARINVPYPPASLVFHAIKDQRRLEIFAAGPAGPLTFLRSYPILAASGGPGPKLREGDRQVPEGIYQIESINPNSSYHLSLRINYPNATDREHARAENRTTLGGDIMIHGKSGSVGCLAMGDPASEDLFVLAADTGIDRITVLLTPTDLRVPSPPPLPKSPPWMPALYDQLREEVRKLPPAP